MTRQLAFAAAAIVLAATIIGCTVSLGLDDTEFVCATDADCAPGFVCTTAGSDDGAAVCRLAEQIAPSDTSGGDDDGTDSSDSEDSTQLDTARDSEQDNDGRDIMPPPRTPCDADNPCPQEQVCARASISDETNYCLDPCVDFFDQTCAARGSIAQRCMPSATVTLQLVYVCLDSGPAGEGAECNGEMLCGKGLVCDRSGTCVRPDCAVDGADPRCSEDGATCTSIEIFGTIGALLTPDFGLCTTTASCVPFDPNTPCSDATWCLPSDLTGTTGACATFGNVGSGGRCTASTDCIRDYFCIQPQQGGEGLCRRLCPVTSGAGCSQTQSCVSLGGEQLGLCLEHCTPFVEPSNCSSPEWCLPDLGGTDPLQNGVCMPAFGTATEGQTCTGTDCAAGLVCAGDPQGSNLTCFRLCPFAGGDIQCESGRTCVDSGIPDIGICI